MPPKREEKIIGKEIESRETKEVAGFFGVDGSLSFLIQKSERIAAAVYVITNLFSDTEPLKWSLRQNVLEIINKTSSLTDKNTLEQKNICSSVISLVSQINSSFEVLRLSGFVSEMNYQVIRRELKVLIRVVLEEQEKISKVKLSGIKEDFFTVKGYGTEPSDSIEQNQNLKMNLSEETLKSYGGQTVNKDNSIVHGLKINDENLKDSIKINQRKITRRDVILNFIKKKNTVSIKDLFGVVNNCSSKTIQRELLALVKKGVLKKEGERRWSKYSLND